MFSVRKLRVAMFRLMMAEIGSDESSGSPVKRFSKVLAGIILLSLFSAFRTLIAS